MTKFSKKQNFQIITLIVLILGVIVSVYLTQKIQILKSRASDGFTWTDFVDSFGAEDGDESYNYSLDVNEDGKINIIDILLARKQDEDNYIESEDEDTTGEEDISEEEDETEEENFNTEAIP